MNIILKNSKIFFIHDYPKEKSLKQKHFSNFLNNISNSPYYNLITTKRMQDKRKIKIKIKDINGNYNNHNKIKKENTSPELVKFKKPKSMNYNLRFKVRQCRNNNKKSQSEKNNIFNYKTYLNNEPKYDPNKISNNYLNLFKENEGSKLSPTPKKEKLKLKIVNNKKNRKNQKDINKYEVREGYFGRKEKMGIPYLFDTSIIFNNKYYNKSEKKRHENILNELYKLKGFLVGESSLQISTFKDFLNKYNIKNYELFSDEKIISICNTLKNKDKNFLISFLKPYLCNKDMIIDFFNTISTINDTNNMDKYNNNNIEMKSINYNFDNDNKKKIFEKQNSDSQIFYNIDDDLFFKTKINNNNKKENKKESRNIIIDITNNLSDKINNNNSKDYFSKTDNSFFTKNTMIIYKSPFFVPYKKHFISSSKNKLNYKGPKKKLELSDTNSLLKKLSYQTKALGPNNDLIISDISKEIKDLKNKYNRVLITGKIYNLKEGKEKNKTQTRFHFSKNKLQNEFYLFKNKVLSHSPSVAYKYPKLKSKDFFSKTSIQFYNNNVNLKEKNEIRNKKINLQIISLKNENFEKLKKCSSNTHPTYEKIIKNKYKSLNERNIRMYYKPIKYQFGYKQVKDMHKLTECAALTFAKKKKYDPLGLLCNI